MCKNCAFSICTKNYIGLASVLGASIHKYYDDFDFYIFVADEFEDKDIELPSHIKVIKKLNLVSEEQWINFSFKYDLTEFCTTLKPFVFKYLFETTEYEKICYFDPDILFFSSIKPVYEALDNAVIELTPHFVTFPQTDISRKLEDELRLAGLYNLGFLGLKRNEKVLKMLDWWKNNLSDKGFSNIDKVQFTDQKWMDFMTLWFDKDELCINKNIGMNVAPWNYFERKIIKDGDSFHIAYRSCAENFVPLIFAHYSGFNYRKLLSAGIIEEKHTAHAVDFDDVKLIMNEYADVLRKKNSEINKYFDMQYSYGIFYDGTKIDLFHRRLYDSYYKNLNKKIENPFDTESSFFLLLVKNRLFDNEKKQNLTKELESNVVLQTKKISQIRSLFCLALKILGYRRYTLFLRFIKKICQTDYQLFLLDKNFIVWNI